LKICLHDLIESMACSVVSDTTSPSGPELSAASSLFLGTFLGSIMFMFYKEFMSQRKMHNFVECNLLLSLDNKNEIRKKTKCLLTFNSFYDGHTVTGGKTLMIFFNEEDMPRDR